MNEAAMAALEEKLRPPQSPSEDRPQITIKSEHFEQAMKKITPSVSVKVFAYAILFIVWIFNLTRLKSESLSYCFLWSSKSSIMKDCQRLSEQPKMSFRAAKAVYRVCVAS